jgi:SET domain-containing protein
MAEKQVDREAEAAPSSRKAPGRRIQVRRSGVHGKGVFALQDIAEGETVIEYVGEVITWKEADKRGPSDPNDENHTFFFSVKDGKRVIDANVGGNAARWINHSCKPNCEADEDDETNRVFIKALRNIKAGEELNYDYGLVIDEKLTKKLRDQYKCLCGAKRCRGTMLALPDRADGGKKKGKKKK